MLRERQKSFRKKHKSQQNKFYQRTRQTERIRTRRKPRLTVPTKRYETTIRGNGSTKVHMTRVFINSPPERPGGADDIIPDRHHSRKSLLLFPFPPDPTHPIGRQQQPRPQLGSGAADPRADPVADHTPG